MWIETKIGSQKYLLKEKKNPWETIGKRRQKNQKKNCNNFFNE